MYFYAFFFIRIDQNQLENRVREPSEARASFPVLFAVLHLPALSGFIRFYPVLSGFGGFYRALVGFGGLSWVWVGFSASVLVDVGPQATPR